MNRNRNTWWGEIASEQYGRSVYVEGMWFYVLWPCVLYVCFGVLLLESENSCAVV